jgi:hypothetical protein
LRVCEREKDNADANQQEADKQDPFQAKLGLKDCKNRKDGKHRQPDGQAGEEPHEKRTESERGRKAHKCTAVLIAEHP